MNITPHARLTADTLNAGMCRQITKFLKQTLDLDEGIDHLTPYEKGVIQDARVALDTIISWQTPKKPDRE